MNKHRLLFKLSPSVQTLAFSLSSSSFLLPSSSSSSSAFLLLLPRRRRTSCGTEEPARRRDGGKLEQRQNQLDAGDNRNGWVGGCLPVGLLCSTVLSGSPATAAAAQRDRERERDGAEGDRGSVAGMRRHGHWWISMGGCQIPWSPCTWEAWALASVARRQSLKAMMGFPPSGRSGKVQRPDLNPNVGACHGFQTSLKTIVDVLCWPKSTSKNAPIGHSLSGLGQRSHDMSTFLGQISQPNGHLSRRVLVKELQCIPLVCILKLT